MPTNEFSTEPQRPVHSDEPITVTDGATSGIILGISGKQFAGKDQLTEILLRHLPSFKQTPLALALKEAYAQQYGLTLEEIETNKAQHRPRLISLGNHFRSQDPDYWLKRVLQKPGNKIISDVRLQRELDTIKQAGGFLVRIEASEAVRRTRGTIISANDLTETDLDKVTSWDAVIQNEDTLSELETHVTEKLIPQIQTLISKQNKGNNPL